jgi:saccharopine dehydrogenase (NAD+, L-lysine-forming)
MRVGILGATGQAGQLIARWVISENIGDVALMGRNREKLETLRETLLPKASSIPETAVVDVLDQQSLEQAFQKIDIAIIALSSYEQLPAVIRAALNTKTDCLDILLCSAAKRQFLEAQRELFEKRGLCCITDAGYHPGVPAALARYAEELCPGLRSVEIYGSFGVNWSKKHIAPETMTDFMRELKTMDMSVLKDGTWISSWKHIKRFDFGDGRGEQDCAAMGMDEMRHLLRFIPTVNNAGFYVAGFGRLIDWGIMPLSLLALNLFPNATQKVAHFFVWGLKTFGPEEEWAKLHLKGHGENGTIDIVMSYPDAYELTALPVIACLKQYVEQPERAGMWHQALYVDPCRFMMDLQRMGVTVTASKSPNR